MRPDRESGATFDSVPTRFSVSVFTSMACYDTLVRTNRRTYGYFYDIVGVGYGTKK